MFATLKAADERWIFVLDSSHFSDFLARRGLVLKLMQGRDITLLPRQAGEPLNTFVLPYVEVNGKVHNGVKWTMSFKEF